mgnify:CR=1 FL=1|jgi:DNA-binding transcriptional MerR regulator
MPPPSKLESLDKLYYSISEVSEMTELPVSTLRFWEKEFSELSPKRTQKGRRLYSTKDIETIRMLRFLLKDRGLKLDAAKAELRNNRKGVDKTHDVVRRLQGVRATLLRLLEAAQSRK